MFLTKYRPSNSANAFDRDLFPALHKWFGSEENGREMFQLPRTNISETDNEFVLTMEMPGVEKKNVNVSIENDHIVITGERTEKTEEKGLLRREIRSASFKRSFQLDATIDRDSVKAKLEDGVLKVTLTKKAESVGRQVSVD